MTAIPSAGWDHSRGPANLPAAAVDWTAQASGTGTQTLHWNTDSGAQTLVVMNADGSPSVSGQVVSEVVTVPALPWIAAGLLAGGVILLASAGTLIVRPVRRARSRHSPDR
ncbi:MAG: hypothetical protein ACRDQU_02595 [Pseudonocardiaceae bacterium]